MKKKLKKGSALALALVLTLSTVVMSKVQAAISIETDRQCSVKFELDAVYPELSGENMTIPVRMYKVADVNQYGEYQALAGFEELKLDSISSKTTAQEWEEKAKSAVKAVEENQTEANEIPVEAFDMMIGNIIDDKEVQDKVGYEKYDIVVANILADVLVPLTPVILNQMKKGGIYITSGIIDDKEETVVNAVKAAGLEVLEVTHQGEWVSVTARKN